MKSTILVTCHKCGHERDVTRNEVVTGRWKRAACPACGYSRDPPSPTTTMIAPCSTDEPPGAA